MLDLFRVYREVPGTLIQPRISQVERSLRIDRILTPTTALLDMGWKHGAIGIEIKRSGVKIGPALAQAMDYVRGSWNLPSAWIQLSAVFVWPMHQQSGPLASMMVQSRVGSASFDGYDRIKLALGSEVVLVDGYDGVRVGDVRSGRKVGSR